MHAQLALPLWNQNIDPRRHKPFTQEDFIPLGPDHDSMSGGNGALPGKVSVLKLKGLFKSKTKTRKTKDSSQ